MVKLYSRFDKNIQDSFFQSLGINIIWVDSYTEIPKILGDLIK